MTHEAKIYRKRLKHVGSIKLSLLTPSYRQLIFPILGVTIHIFGLVGDKLITKTFLKILVKKIHQGGPWGAIGIFKEICFQGIFIVNVL